MCSRLLPLTALALTLSACGDDASSGAASGGGTSGIGGAAPSSSPGSGDPSGTGGSDATGPGAGGSGQGAGGPGSGGAATTATTTGSGGAPPCTAQTLAESVRSTPIAIAGASGTRAVTAQAGSGSFVAWAGSDGSVHVTPLDAVDARAGEDLTVEGTEIFGVAATESDVAILFGRQPDFMTFVRMDRAGVELARTDLVGGGDHDVEGTEWFYEFARTGRLVAQGDGSFAAYHALHRHWPDGIGHQGDTLRFLDGSGAPVGAGWGWGCSHSMDQRLAHGPNGVVPICIADCYPGKGIYFNHQQSMITDDPAANCAGGFTTRLGGLVATAGGFVLVYQDDEGGAHLGVFDTAGASVSDRGLDVEGSSRLAAYDGGLLLGSAGASGARLHRLDAAGVAVGEPAEVAGLPLPDQDFEGRSDGDVAWASASGASLTVVRARVCD